MQTVLEQQALEEAYRLAIQEAFDILVADLIDSSDDKAADVFVSHMKATRQAYRLAHNLLFPSKTT
jgi:hypothetical protein